MDRPLIPAIIAQEAVVQQNRIEVLHHNRQTLEQKNSCNTLIIKKRHIKHVTDGELGDVSHVT